MKEDNKERLKEYRKNYYLNNKDKINNFMKKYQEDNKERLKEYRKQHYLKNKERIKNYQKKYRIVYHLKNRDKIKLINKAWEDKNRDYRLAVKREWKRKNHAKYRYGITFEEYDFMMRNSFNCAICNKQFDNKLKKNLDHNHTTKKIRGVLCHYCNLILGLAKEDINILNNAINYLRRYEIL